MFHETTELLWTGCLTGLIWTQKIQIHYIDTKHRLADMLTKGNFTREGWNNLSFVQYHPFQLHLLYQEFQFAKLLHNGEEDSKSKRRGSGCVQVATSSDEYFFLSYAAKFLCRFKSDCIKKSGDVWSFGETW